MGVVPEPFGAPALQGDPALTRPFGYQLDPIGKDRDRNASIATRAVGVRNAAQRLDELCVVHLVGRIRPRVARGEDSRCPIECVDLDPRVVRDGGHAGLVDDRARFRQCVVGEGVERLGELETGRNLVDRDEFNVGKQDRYLLGLVFVARCEDSFQSASAFS